MHARHDICDLFYVNTRNMRYKGIKGEKFYENLMIQSKWKKKNV